MSLNTHILDEYRDLLGEEFAPFFKELLDSFFETTPKLLQTMQDALEEGDIALFTRSAHSLKSNSRTFGADDFADIAMELEEYGAAEDVEKIDQKLEQLLKAYPSVMEELKQLQREIE